jgi:hypothetical protein
LRDQRNKLPEKRLDKRLFLAVANLGTHAALFAPLLSPTLSRSLRAQSNLQVFKMNQPDKLATILNCSVNSLGIARARVRRWRLSFREPLNSCGVLTKMTAYIANYEKKNRIFAQREQQLRHAIKHNFPTEKILVAAEKLRAAKVAVYKCRFAKNNSSQPHNFKPEEMAKQDTKLQRWLSMTATEIVDAYRVTR